MPLPSERELDLREVDLLRVDAPICRVVDALAVAPDLVDLDDAFGALLPEEDLDFTLLFAAPLRVELDDVRPALFLADDDRPAVELLAGELFVAFEDEDFDFELDDFEPDAFEAVDLDVEDFFVVGIFFPPVTNY